MQPLQPCQARVLRRDSDYFWKKRFKVFSTHTHFRLDHTPAYHDLGDTLQELGDPVVVRGLLEEEGAPPLHQDPLQGCQVPRQ